MSSRLLPSGADRFWRHQLAFELSTSSVLAVATREWALVAFYGLVILPAVRRTWVHWIRSGIGLVPTGLAVVLAWSSGIGAVATVWSIACATGIIGLGNRGGSGHAGTERRVGAELPRPESGR